MSTETLTDIAVRTEDVWKIYAQEPEDVEAVQASYQIHPLWGVDLLTLTSLVDGSFLLSGGASWSVGSNSSLRGGFFLGFGDDTVDPATGLLGSEFGGRPNVGYVSISHFF